MRRAVPAAAAACLLAGPTVLAFFSGGYNAEPRLLAAIVVWMLILALAIAGPVPLPRELPGRLALGGLALLTAWTALSITWAPLRGPAVASVERLLLYTGALALAIAVLRTPRILRAVEPVLAAGVTIVIGYGLAGRLLPGILELARSRSAGGRLEQPITYWNAEGALAAMGLVLCARVAGDPTRPLLARRLAAAACVPLGAGVYLSYSRGAIAAAVLGLVVLVAATPTRRQLRAAALALLAAVAAAAGAAGFAGVASLHGSLPARERDGAIVLAILVILAAVAAVLAGRAPNRPEAQLASAHRLGRIAAVVVAAVALGLVAGGLRERPTAEELAAGAQARRLTAVSSNRYEYWRVGLDAFAREPLTGLGAGGFRVEWLKQRSIAESVKDTHSLEVEMAAELGIVGLLSLALIVAAVALGARQALRWAPELAAGPLAAAVAWLLHASIDWDWQLPAVSLPALVLAAALLSAARPAGPAAAAPPAPAARRPDHARA